MKIKFRAWDIRKNVMREVVVLHFNEASNISGASYWSEDMELKSLHGKYIKLMQYTGLKDSNGTEIYEGDLLSIQIVRDAKKTVTIVFEDGAFGVKDELFGWGYGKGFYPLKTIINNHKVEIIGNIYQNKELLEGE